MEPISLPVSLLPLVSMLPDSFSHSAWCNVGLGKSLAPSTNLEDALPHHHLSKREGNRKRMETPWLLYILVNERVLSFRGSEAVYQQREAGYVINGSEPRKTPLNVFMLVVPRARSIWPGFMEAL